MSWSAVAVCLIAGTTLALHVAAAASGAYLNHISGIWLALASDLTAGEFYRPIVSDAGFGGTRYFPVFFIGLAAALRAGASPVVAGWIVTCLAATLLAGGMYRLVRALDGSRPLAATFASAVLAPYFVQQTLFEFRADPLSAALVMIALSYVASAWRAGRGIGLAALWLALAVATKVSAGIVGAAVIAGLAASGRPGLGLGIGWRWLGWLAVFALAVEIASSGRAMENWRALMFAGAGATGTAAAVIDGSFLPAVAYSYLLWALLLLVTGVLLAGAVLAVRGPGPRRPRLRRVLMPAVIFAGGTASAVFVLSSPGAVASNHMVEWITVSLAVAAWMACTEQRLTRPVFGAVFILVVAMSVQDLARAREATRWAAAGRDRAAVSSLVARVAVAPGPVLADSPLWSVLASREVPVLDAYAFRLLSHHQPDLEVRLVAAIDARQFPLVILQLDPATPRGRAYYEHVHFGARVRDAILAAYAFEATPLGDAVVYVPRP